jgi:molybdopterin-guanine dinucleotide biosynthesis protein A
MRFAGGTEVGIVLTGGKSSRMGQDKAQLVGAHGVRLLDRAIALLHAAEIFEVWVSGSEALPDVAPGLGPLAGIAAAAERAADGTRLFVVPVDMPALRAEDLRALRAAGTTAHFRGAPLPAVLHVDPALRARIAESLAGDRAVRSLLAGARVLEPADEATLANVNTPAEWAAYSRG